MQCRHPFKASEGALNQNSTEKSREKYAKRCAGCLKAVWAPFKCVGWDLESKLCWKKQVKERRAMHRIFGRLWNLFDRQNSIKKAEKSTPRDAWGIWMLSGRFFTYSMGFRTKITGKSWNLSATRDSRDFWRPFGRLLSVFNGSWNQNASEKAEKITPRDKYAKFAKFFFCPSHIPSSQLITEHRRSIKPPKSPIKPKLPATEQSKLQ